MSSVSDISSEHRPLIKDGDVYVMIRTDSKTSLEHRMEVLAYAFAKTVQGSTLRVICEWKIKEGFISFIVGGKQYPNLSHGKIEVEFEQLPVEVESREIVQSDDGDNLKFQE